MKDVSGIFPFPFIAERCLKHPSVCNFNIMRGLYRNLKDEVSFCKIPV